jgi:hypothetical protein
VCDINRGALVFLGLIVIGFIGLSILTATNNGAAPAAPAQPAPEPPQPSGSPAPPSEAGPVLTATGSELVFKTITGPRGEPYTIEYEFAYPARIGYEFEFTTPITFSVNTKDNQQAAISRDQSRNSGRFDVNEGEPGTWSFTFVSHEGELSGTFRLVEIVKFE